MGLLLILLLIVPLCTSLVGLFINKGAGIHDGSFNEAAYEGLVRAQNELGIQFLLHYSPDDYNVDVNLPVVDNWVAQEMDLIFFVGFPFENLLRTASAKYINNTRTRFVIIDQALTSVPGNVQSILFREDQAAFLMGILAARITKTQKICALGGLPIPPVNKFLAGFAAGMRYQCPNCTVQAQYLFSFVDQTVGAEVAEHAVTGGCDVLFTAAGASGTSALLYAANQTTPAGDPVWVIGVDVDQYSTIFNQTGELMTRIVSSAIKKVDVAIFLAIRDKIQGKFVPGQRVFDAANNAIGYADCHDACDAWGPGTASILENAFNFLADGSLQTGVGSDGYLTLPSSSNEWKQVPAFNGWFPPRNAHATAYSASLGVEFLTYGGITDQFGFNPSSGGSDLWSLRVETYGLVQLTSRNLMTGDFPLSRSSHTFTAISTGECVMIGGKSSNQVFVDTLSILNPPNPFSDPPLLSYHWTTVAGLVPSPPALIDHTAVAWQEKSILVFGGRSEFATENNLWKFTLGDNENFNDSKWELVTTSGSRPPGTSQHTAVIIGDQMLIYGGIDLFFVSMSTLWSLNLTSMTWTQLPNAPLSRSYHAAVPIQTSLETVMFVYGGRENLQPSSEVWLYFPISRQWLNYSTIKGDCKGRYRHSMLVLEQRVYILAGLGEDGGNLGDICYLDFNEELITQPLRVIELGPLEWKQALGYVALVYMMVALPASGVLIAFGARRYPLRARSRPLLFFSLFGVAMFAHIPIVEIVQKDFPCWVYYWMYYLAPPCFISPVLVSMWHQYMIRKYSLLKTKYAGAREISKADMTRLRAFKKSFRDLRLFGYTCLLLIIPIFLAAVTFSAASDAYDYSAGNYGCCISTRISWVLGIYLLIYGIIVAYALHLIRKSHEVWGFRLEIFYLCCYAGTLGFLLLLIVYAADPDPETKNDLALIIWLIPIIYHFRNIFLPALRTLKIYSALTTQEETETLGDILLTKRGFKYFLHYATGEFSEENPLCWKAIQTFKTKTSYNAFCDIYTKYIMRGAPLEVNLSYATKVKIEEVKKVVTPDTPLEELQSVFDEAQLELLGLMQDDSYKRFLSHELYQNYKAHAPLKTDIDEISQSAPPGDVGSPSRLQSRNKGEHSVLDIPGKGRTRLSADFDEESQRREDSKETKHGFLRALTADSRDFEKGASEAELSRLKIELMKAKSRIEELEALLKLNNIVIPKRLKSGSSSDETHLQEVPVTPPALVHLDSEHEIELTNFQINLHTPDQIVATIGFTDGGSDRDNSRDSSGSSSSSVVPGEKEKDGLIGRTTRGESIKNSGEGVSNSGSDDGSRPTQNGSVTKAGSPGSGRSPVTIAQSGPRRQ